MTKDTLVYHIRFPPARYFNVASSHLNECHLKGCINIPFVHFFASFSFTKSTIFPPVNTTQVPLAERLRPTNLEELIGQQHLTGNGSILRTAIDSGRIPSMILWGPPGVGKTTIARLLADRAGLEFVQLSAVFSGVADLRKAFEAARARREAGQGTLLFVDEIHRFNRAQQDGFLPYVEEGVVTLVGATTENPSFELNGALLSRAQVFVLNRLDEVALEGLLDLSLIHI